MSRNKIFYYQNIAIAYICTWAVSPPISYGTIPRGLVLLATLFWILLELQRRNGILVCPTSIVLLTILFVAYTGLMEFALYGSEGPIRALQIYIMLFFLVVQQSRRNEMETLTPVFWWVLCLMPIWHLITVYVLTHENMHAARTIVRSSVEARELSERGVGGYGLVYSTVILLPTIFIIASSKFKLQKSALPSFLRRFPSLPRLIIGINLVTGTTLVFTAGFSIAVIAMIFSFVAAVFLKRYNLSRLMTMGMVFVLALFLWDTLMIEFLNMLLPFTEGTKFHMKVNDILYSIAQGESSGSLAARFERYMRSLNIFLENPLLGVLYFEDIGKHSAILDTFARWGVVVGLILLRIITALPLRYIKNKRTQDGVFGAATGTLIAILVTFGINSAFASAGVMLFLLFPVGVRLIADSNDTLAPRRA